jgi:F-type H+-transporting ATPase subunit b
MLKRLILVLVMLTSFAGWAAAAEHEPAAGHAAGAATPREHELLEFDKNSAVWVLIIFVVLLAILYPTAWKNVLAGLKQREARIRNDIAEAEAARAKAEATLKEYNSQLAKAEARVREMLSNATHEGEKLAEAIQAKGQAEAEETRQRAIREIEAAKKQAITEIYAQAAQLSTSVAEKILRRAINVEDQRELVKRSLEELETVGR